MGEKSINQNHNLNQKPQKKAVALKYPKGAIAPIITAKGKGLVAEQIVAEAENNKIYITENTEVVNMLDNFEAGSLIPEETWQAVAIIFSFILGEESGK